MVNLLQETIDNLLAHNKDENDVLWVGDSTSSCSWEEFASRSNFNYDNGYGGEAVNTSLIVVGKGWWLERGTYDGSEWWEFKTGPKKKRGTKVSITTKEEWEVRYPKNNVEEN